MSDRLVKAVGTGSLVWTYLTVAAAILVCLASGCDEDDRPEVSPEVRGTPTAEECADGVVLANKGIALPATLLWVSGEHDFGETSSFFLCQQELLPASIELYPRDGVLVVPSKAYFDETTLQVLEFQVTVERDVDVLLPLAVELGNGGSQGAVHGLAIESSDEGWSFAREDSDK